MNQTAAPLLTYSLATSPYPVLVSASNEQPSLVNLTIVVSCSEDLGSCSVGQIAVRLPVGDDSDSSTLTPTAPPRSAGSISSSDAASWAVSPGIAAGAYVFTPPDGSVVIEGQSLTIQITGIEVSTVVGTTEIVVDEWAAPGSGEPPPAKDPPSGRLSLPIAKFPSGFYAYGFAPSRTSVRRGESVTLTWYGSANAEYTISYDASKSPESVRPPAWTSPPLDETTSFELTASASVGGQTVSLSQTTAVTIAEPQVVEFVAVPSEIDPQQSVVLQWLAVDADGVYLLTGETSKVKLAKRSDPNDPYTLEPQYGTEYWLQAFRAHGPAEVTSELRQLALTYNPIEITFTADPMICDLDKPDTTLHWTVLHAKSVTLDGQEVDFQGTRQETPRPPSSTYELVATWVDGSQQSRSLTVECKVATVVGYSATFETVALGPAVTLTVTTANVQWLEIPKAILRLTMPGEEWKSDPVPNVVGRPVDRTQFDARFVFGNAPGDWQEWPNIGLIFDLKVSGPGAPPETAGNVVMYRGSFD